MSHFIGLVFVNPMEAGLDEMLEPFGEENEDYFSFEDCTDEVKKAYDELPDELPESGEYWREIDRTEEINKIWDEAPEELDEEQENSFWKPYTKKDYPTPAEIAKDKDYEIVPDETQRNGVRFVQRMKDNYANTPNKKKYNYDIDEFANRWFGYKKVNGRYGYRHNPNAKWDWYVDGGRWSGYLINKEGNKTDCDLLTEIDWDKQEVPFCFVDTDGVWHEKGEMGWWAMVSNEKKKGDWHEEFKAYVQSLLAEAYDEDGNPYEDGVQVYAVDFHI